MIKNKLLQHWLLLSNIFFALLLGCFSYQAMASDDRYECDLNWIVYHPIDKCANVFSQKLASLGQKDIARYEEKFEQLKTLEDPYTCADMLALTTYYPKPEVLFESLQRGEILYKYEYAYGDKKVVYNSATDSLYNEYGSQNVGYQILAKMLENQTSLSDSEKKMLTVSKQRAACIDEVQQYFRDNPDLPISVHYISDKCYF